MTLLDKERREGVLPFAGQDREHKEAHLRFGNDGSNRQDLFETGVSDETPSITGADKTLTGTDGDDRLTGGREDDVIDGGDGDDVLTGGAGRDVITGGAGNDTLDYAYSIENVDINLAAGQSTFGSGSIEITTNFENDIGSQGVNVITGTAGDNVIDGGAGDDVIKGGAGNDRLKGGSGADIFEFSKGDGIDIIDDFDPSTDTLSISGAGNDSIIIEYLTIGTLITYGRDADGNPIDQVFLVGVASGLVTNDDIEKPDVDFIGTNDADNFEGTGADEVIATHDGDDLVIAAGGNDYIQTGAGADEIHAGAGNDYVEAGPGADLVWLDAGDDADMIELDFGDGIDTMTDFEDGLDIIDLSATGLTFADFIITDAADGVHIAYETDAGGAVIGELILTDVTASSLSEEDFQFG